MRRSIPFPRATVLGGLAVAAIAALGAPVLAAPARAASKVDADFAKYCRTRYPNSIHRVLRTRWGPKHVCRQSNARGFTNQGIDYAEACRLTTGSRRYQTSGARVLCLKGGATRGRPPGLRTAGEPDYRRYCRTKYPNSIYVRRRGRATHLCRQPGRTQGYVLHNINLAEACRMTYGSRRYRKVGARVLCRARGVKLRRGDPAAMCRQVCGGQPSAGARAWCYQHFTPCHRH